MHWTQRPENRAKVKAMARKGWKKRNDKRQPLPVTVPKKRPRVKRERIAYDPGFIDPIESVDAANRMLGDLPVSTIAGMKDDDRNNLRNALSLLLQKIVVLLPALSRPVEV